MSEPTIEHKITILATPEEVYNLLMDSAAHSAFTGADAEIVPIVGGEYMAYDEYITGTTLELQPNKYIRQTWIAHDDKWPENHISEIEFILQPSDEGTLLTFKHHNVPDGRYEEFNNAWYDYYWDPMEDYFNQ